VQPVGRADTWTVDAATDLIVDRYEAVSAAATSIGATDLFVFRRITADRFVHVGGVGRGEGWAGNIDLSLTAEDLAREAMTTGAPVFARATESAHVFGPYYQREAVYVPLPPDVIVVFGAAEPGALSSDGTAITTAAEDAAAVIDQVSTAKRLADELELLHAVHSLARTDAVRIRDVMRHVVKSAIEALSCDLGVIYVAELDVTETAAAEPGHEPEAGFFLPAMRALHAEAAGLPTCIQDSVTEPPPHPLSACGATSHYALPIGTPPFGVLAVMHTEARPRGFTTLCREVGLRLAESAGPLLRSALTLHELEAQLDQVGRDARMDPLTRLPNRRAWEERIDDPAVTRGPAGVIVLDVDGLKAANDARGHHFGDEYLQLVAATVAENLREGDFVARLGGDEFAVLLPGADEPKCAAVAKGIEAALAAHPTLDGFPLAASVGHATMPPARSIVHAQHLADESMYATKQPQRDTT
jgi:diguanylate cyclase (GGDEF)-like protein